jgi:hypothetical protein
MPLLHVVASLEISLVVMEVLLEFQTLLPNNVRVCVAMPLGVPSVNVETTSVRSPVFFPPLSTKFASLLDV